MPGLKQPCRLVQISDLHRSWCVAESFIQRIVTQSNALKPDVIALTGDFVTHHSDYIGSCLNALRPLHAPLGQFAVLGNHDYAADDLRGGHPITEALTAQGIHVLTNRSERLDNNLRLVGVDDYRFGTPRPTEAFHKVEKSEAVLAMTHSPFVFESMCKYDCVTIAGHTHGGQVNIPGLTSLPHRLENALSARLVQRTDRPRPPVRVSRSGCRWGPVPLPLSAGNRRLRPDSDINHGEHGEHGERQNKIFTADDADRSDTQMIMTGEIFLSVLMPFHPRQFCGKFCLFLLCISPCSPCSPWFISYAGNIAPHSVSRVWRKRVRASLTSRPSWCGRGRGR